MDTSRRRPPLPSERKPSKATALSHGFIKYVLWMVAGVVVVFILAKLGAFKPDNPHNRPIAASTGLPVDGEVVAGLIKRQASFPVRIDEATELVDVTGAGDTLTYHYKVTGVEITDPELFKAGISQALCQDPNLSDKFEQGFVVGTSYKNESGSSLIRFTTAPSDCGL